MKFETVHRLINGVPFITDHHAKVLYDFIVKNKPRMCLELGHAHGASTSYIAAALDEVGESGHLVTVDLLNSKDRDPNIETLLARLNLREYVTVQREVNSYNWFLKKEIESNTGGAACEPKYDFCFIDGAKNWTIDGLAFFLVDKLLNEGGWLLFDDFKWSYTTTGRDETDGVTNRSLGTDELQQAHIEQIFKLLVMQHPNYSEFTVQDDWWAWARKVRSDKAKVSVESSYSSSELLRRGLRKMARKLVGAASRNGGN